MAGIKGTQTEKNLLASFAGESQARNRYTMFSKQAMKDGYEQIAAIFLETADNERIHAKKFFSFLEGGNVEITATYPAGIVGNTLENLKAAADGEHEEFVKLYPGGADTADKEGFKEIAAAFRLISKIESEHEKRYRKLADNIEKNLVFTRPEKVRWKCRVCGHIHEGVNALEKCPSCGHSKAYFEIAADNY
jgi:rubrerythrin